MLAAIVPLVVISSLLFQPVGAVNDHYVYLARSFARGLLDVDGMPAYADVVAWGGHTYVPFGPLPAVLLIPLLPLFDAGLRLVWAGHLVTLANVLLLWRVLARVGITGERRHWALLLFFTGSVYLSVAMVGVSYYFAHLVSAMFVLLAMDEMLGRRRAILVGLFLGGAVATRSTLLFAAPFFLWLAWREQRGRARPLFRWSAFAARLGIGLLGPVLLILLYNALRFGSPFETGYALAQLNNPVLQQARAQGLFSPLHIPKNLFMLLLQGPQPFPGADAPVLLPPYVVPSPWGMGLFIASPALLYAFRPALRSPLVQACWIGIASVLVPIVTYYGVGWVQTGYRYALDFLPLVLVLAALGFPNPLTRKAKGLILASVLLNAWGGLFLVAGLRS